VSVHSNKGLVYLILLLLICGLIGGAIGEALGENFNSLILLKKYFLIGMSNPVTLDLKLISLTFGINFRVNILSLLGMLVGFLIYKKM
jgi:hypothetical protein